MEALGARMPLSPTGWMDVEGDLEGAVGGGLSRFGEVEGAGEMQECPWEAFPAGGLTRPALPFPTAGSLFLYHFSIKLNNSGKLLLKLPAKLKADLTQGHECALF